MDRKNIELLSAYIDGELSPGEVKELEEKLSYSSELRDKLEELKKIKDLTRTSVKRISESPYFETKLLARLEEKSGIVKIKKWSPVIGFAALTIIIMLLLKFNPNIFENIFEEQKLNIAGFYKENLKPLLFASELSNEDIFNFAFYNQLPLDNTKSQYIQLGSDQSGNEYFEINTAGFSAKEDNFRKFVETLSLNTEQKQQFDSLMSSYARALQTQILVNDKNTVAINPNLWNYQKAIVAEILAFAKASSKGVADAMPSLFKVETPVVQQVVHNVKAHKDNEYIFFTPDSLFIDTFVFDEGEFEEEMKLTRTLVKKNLEDLKKHKKDMNELKLVNLNLDSSIINLKKSPRFDRNINVFIDSNFCRVHIDKIEIPGFVFPDMDSLESIINEATKQVKAFTFKFDLPETGKQYRKFDFKFEQEDSTGAFNFSVPVPDIDSILSEHFNNLNLPDAPFVNDSLMEQFNFFRYDDSTFTGNQEQFEFRMKEFEEEMQKFKEEMEKLKKEIRKKDSVKVIKNKFIEI